MIAGRISASDPGPFIFRQHNRACFAWQQELLVMLSRFSREFAATCIAACDMKASLLCFHSQFFLHVSCSRLKPQASFCIGKPENHRKNHGEQVPPCGPRMDRAKWKSSTTELLTEYTCSSRTASSPNGLTTFVLASGKGHFGQWFTRSSQVQMLRQSL